MDAEKILRDLQATLPQEEKSLLYFKKFDLLLRELEVNVSQMAVALHYDSSYIPRSGQEREVLPIQVLL